MYNLPRYFIPSFESTDLSVQEEKCKINFHDGRHGKIDLQDGRHGEKVQNSFSAWRL